MTRTIRLAPFLVFLVLVPVRAGSEALGPAPTFEGLGDHHHTISTDVEEAQRYFNQGLVLAFGFNHREAHRSFLAAARRDPDCAMCWWGAAWVLGPNINAAMDPADVSEAWRLLGRAREAMDGATERERAYVRALEERYRESPVDDRSELDRAFAEAMDRVAERHPDDLDAQVIAAEAWMDTTPWDYWNEDGSPKPTTRRVLDLLSEVLRRDPRHPMANHLMIHAVEARHPERALEEAERLKDLVPGAGHLVHMPAHVYIRVGRYHEASRANRRAIEADRRYLERVEAEGAYPLAYVPHNYHFLWATATLEGRGEVAIAAARDMSAMVDRDRMRERGLTTLQHYWITPLYALVRFGRWDAILDRPAPAEDLVYPRAVWHYARGMALTRKGRFDEARAELASLDRLREDPSLQWVTVWDINKSRHILEIARHALAGELAAARGAFDLAIERLETAVEREDALNYDEPPSWHYPTRQSLGAVLLEAGRPERAEAIYREDLEAFPENGWSLFGLLESLRRQGKHDEARDVQRRFREAWRHADVVLTASRF